MTYIVCPHGRRYRLIREDRYRLLLLDERDDFAFLINARRLQDGWRLDGRRRRGRKARVA